MIRFLLAGGVAALLLGSVAWCQVRLTQRVVMRWAGESHAETHPEAENAVGFDLVLTPGFDAASDPFGLDQADTAARLVVRSEGRALAEWREDLGRGVPVRVSGVSLAPGPVELFVEAVPNEADVPSALRIQVHRGETLMADTTVWSAGMGAALAERVVLDLRPRRTTLDRGLGRAHP